MFAGARIHRPGRPTLSARLSAPWIRSGSSSGSTPIEPSEDYRVSRGVLLAVRTPEQLAGEPLRRSGGPSLPEESPETSRCSPGWKPPRIKGLRRNQPRASPTGDRRVPRPN